MIKPGQAEVNVSQAFVMEPVQVRRYTRWAYGESSYPKAVITFRQYGRGTLFRCKILWDKASSNMRQRHNHLVMPKSERMTSSKKGENNYDHCGEGRHVLDNFKFDRLSVPGLRHQRESRLFQ